MNSFGVIKWSKTETEELLRNIRTTLTRHRYHHPKSAVERTMVPRREGGQGIIDIPSLKDCQVMGMRNYFQKKAERSTIIKAVVNADANLTPLNLRNKEESLKDELKQRKVDRINHWKNKAIHGRFYNCLLYTSPSPRDRTRSRMPSSA